MKFNILRKAFSLTELLIVLVVVAVLFAAMVPIMTKRGSGSTTGNESPWLYVRDDEQSNIYFDPGPASLTGTAFVGLKSSDLVNQNPLSKLVIKANYQQGLIQFREGNDGDGEPVGIFATNKRSNASLLSTTSLLSEDCNGPCLMDVTNVYGSNAPHTNSVFGSNAASNVEWMTASTLIGANSGFGLTGKKVNAVTSVGANSNRFLSASTSTLIGANTALNDDAASTTYVNLTTAIGSGVLGMPDSKSYNNVYLGYNVARDGFGYSNSFNVIANSPYFGADTSSNIRSQIKNSVIVGRKSYDAGMPVVNNLTAIGYNACTSFNPYNEGNNTALNGSTTCIGYNSAAQSGGTSSLRWGSDNYEHIFLGGMPHGFAGRSVLEVHNLPAAAKPVSLTVLPNVAPTVVLNSHLVVRGNMYFPAADTGQLSPYNFQILTDYGLLYGKVVTEKGKDTCRRRCWCVWRCRRTKRFYSSDCDYLGDILDAFINNLIPGFDLFFDALKLADELFGVGPGWIDIFDFSEGFDRVRDPLSMTGIGFSYTKGSDGLYSTPTCSPVNNDHYLQFVTGKNKCPQPLLSDARLKENISENHIALSKLLMVQPYNYTFKMDKAAVPQVGVMAQDLEKYFPTAVFNNQNGYKSIRWDEMFFATVNSIKSLDDSVTKIEYDLVVMDGDTDKIAKDMKNVKNRIVDIEKRIKKLENK